MARCNIHCLVYQQERDCLIAGCGDGSIQLYFADGRVPTCNDMPLPTVLQGAFVVAGMVAPCLSVVTIMPDRTKRVNQHNPPIINHCHITRA